MHAFLNFHSWAKQSTLVCSPESAFTCIWITKICSVSSFWKKSSENQICWTIGIYLLLYIYLKKIWSGVEWCICVSGLSDTKNRKWREDHWYTSWYPSAPWWEEIVHNRGVNVWLPKLLYHKYLDFIRQIPDVS